jgi:hypothetical protein
MSSRRVGERMTRWLDPAGLVVIGVEALLSGLFAQYADRRELEATYPETLTPTFAQRHDLWIDYVADTGDGWDSTASVAWAACHDTTADVNGIDTKVGDLLVFGGDEVYPSAKMERYQRRLIAPYEAAAVPRDAEESGPLLVAIPGNHDWYDGLSAFLRVFTSGEGFGQWTIPQARSYWAVQLPFRWWIIGIDIAFDRYIDRSQIRYFRSLLWTPEIEDPAEASRRIQPKDNVILCTAKPSWVFEDLVGSPRLSRKRTERRALQEFEYEIEHRWGCRLPLVLSGDLHHYARYGSSDRQRLTVGGGGAFLFPTHGLATDTRWDPSPTINADDALPLEDLHLEARYPSPDASRRLNDLVPLAPFKNRWFLVFVGAVAVVLATQGRASFQEPGTSTVQSLLDVSYWTIVGSFFAQPIAGLVAILIVAALIAFADTTGWLLRILVGLVHGGVQLATAAFAIWVSFLLLDLIPGISPDAHLSLVAKILALVVTGGMILVIGGCLGGLVMGLYLWLAQLRNAHQGEAFAALGLERDKCFLRMRLDEDGDLWLHPMKIDRPCTTWNTTRDRPSPTQPIQPSLIEGPIHISGHPPA